MSDEHDETRPNPDLEPSTEPVEAQHPGGPAGDEPAAPAALSDMGAVPAAEFGADPSWQPEPLEAMGRAEPPAPEPAFVAPGSEIPTEQMAPPPMPDVPTEQMAPPPMPDVPTEQMAPPPMPDVPTEQMAPPPMPDVPTEQVAPPPMPDVPTEQMAPPPMPDVPTEQMAPPPMPDGPPVPSVQPAPAMPPASTAPRPPKPDRGRWWLWPVGIAGVLALGVIAAFVIGLVTANAAGQREREAIVAHDGPLAAKEMEARIAGLTERASAFGTDGPLEVANDYLSALAEANVTRALEISGETPSALTTDAVYRESTARISAPWVQRVSTNEEMDQAEVMVGYYLNSQPVHGQEISFSRDASGTWKVDSGLMKEVTINIVRGGKVMLGGADLTAALGAGAANTVKVGALPGIYTLKYSDPKGFLSASDAMLTVGTSDENLSVSITPKLADSWVASVRKQAQSTADQWVEQCRKSALKGNTCGPSAKKEGKYLTGKAWTKIAVKAKPRISITATEDPMVFRYYSTSVSYQSSGHSQSNPSQIVSRFWVTDNFRGTIRLKADGKISMSRGFGN